MTENEAKTEVIKKLETTCAVLPQIFADVGRAAKKATEAFMLLQVATKKAVEIITTAKTIKTIYDADFGIPVKSLFEMDKLGCDMNYLRLCLQYKLAEISPRLMHLATRHGNPRVRKKNQKRIIKMIK